jgi:hypothetical protein
VTVRPEAGFWLRNVALLRTQPKHRARYLTSAHNGIQDGTSLKETEYLEGSMLEAFLYRLRTISGFDMLHSNGFSQILLGPCYGANMNYLQ